MATPWPMRRERCSHGSACLARWSASSFMLLWLPWVLLWLSWPTQAELVSAGGHSGKALHSSLSSPSSSSSSSSSLPSSSSALGFNTKQNGAQLDWLLSEKGPFHRCPEYTEFRERFQQGFSTRYKIYRWERSALFVCVGGGSVCHATVQFSASPPLWPNMKKIEIHHHMVHISEPFL